MQRPLLIVDMQRGNVSEYNRFTPSAIATLVKTELFNPVIFTRFVDTADCPARLFLEQKDFQDFQTAGMDPKIAEIMGAGVPPLDKYGVTELGENYGAKRYLLTKNVYSAVTAEFEELLGELNLDNTGIYIVGADTESQIMKTALDLFERGVEPIVFAEFCGSHRGLGMHERGLELMVELIGKDRVIKDHMPLRQRWERAKRG
jgi:nicotinamidase-related amidase